MLGFDVATYDAAFHIISPANFFDTNKTLISTTNTWGFSAVPSDGGWVSVWIQDPDIETTERGIYARTIGNDGSLGEKKLIAGPSTTGLRLNEVHLAANEGKFLAVYSETSAATPYRVEVKYTVLDSTLAAVEGRDLVALTGERSFVRPQAAAIGDRFFIGFVDFSNRLNVAMVSADGALICGPTQLDITGTWSMAHALAPAGDHVLAVMAGTDGAAYVYRLNDQCGAIGEPLMLNAPNTELARGSDIKTDPDALGVGHPAITTTSAGFATVWIEKDPEAGDLDGGVSEVGFADASSADSGAVTPYRLMSRSFGPLLCE